MITQLASPSVCVIDDEPDDYNCILNALNDLYISAVWIPGTSLEQLPPQPFTRLQLVFLDLHLTNSLGKDAASHAANVFKHVVSADTAPIVIVIWSKYADDPVAEFGVPQDDQETESELFKRTLLEAEPRFKNRLLFLEMDKPKQEERPEDWNARLKEQVTATLGNQPAIGLLWTWDGLVKHANAALMASLTDLAEESAGGVSQGLTDTDMKEVLQRMTKAQAEGDLTAENSAGYLVAILSQLLADQLEHGGADKLLAEHGAWLAQAPGTRTKASISARMNGFLLVADPPEGAPPYMPGMVYRAENMAEFCRLFGVTGEALEKMFCNQPRQSQAARVDEWNAAIRPIALEISPACDVANNKRYQALLIGGFVVPASPADKRPLLNAKNNEAILLLPASPAFALRKPLAGFNSDEIVIALSHRLRVTARIGPVPAWLTPWFRLRELPTTALRNLHMAYASRVGFVSMG